MPRAGQRYPDGRPSKQERVRAIVQLMTTGSWVTKQTEQQLAEKWHMSPHTIHDDASDASRLIRDRIATDEDLRAQVMSTLQTITQRTIHERQYRTAVEALKVLAGVSGAGRPQKVEHSGDLTTLLAIVQREDAEAGTNGEPEPEPGTGPSPEDSAEVGE